LGTTWELEKPFGNLMGTQWEEIGNKGKKQKIPPTPAPSPPSSPIKKITGPLITVEKF
jgi:hypothetical protein